MRIFFITMAFCTLLGFYDANAETRLTSYFSNDSVNGLRISDAYETHNMGVLWETEDFFLNLDLGIVSPDMHVYKNEYRVANRSFGELISLTIGRKQKFNNKHNYSYYMRVISSGEFGIVGMQDLMHRILTLQPVNYVNDLVRMPDKTWYGLGGSFSSKFDSNYKYFNNYGANLYLGTDRAEVAPFVKVDKKYSFFDFTTELGFRYVLFDNIVTAPPISAKFRSFIPYVEVGLDFDYLGLNWYLKDKFSLPTIADDNQLFGILSAGITFDIK